MKKYLLALWMASLLSLPAAALADDVVHCTDGAYLWQSGESTYLDITRPDAVKQFQHRGHIDDRYKNGETISMLAPWDHAHNAWVATLNEPDSAYALAYKRVYAYPENGGLRVVVNGGTYPSRIGAREYYLTDWWFGGCTFSR